LGSRVDTVGVVTRLRAERPSTHALIPSRGDKVLYS
jgi:hypothetical protein